MSYVVTIDDVLPLVTQQPILLQQRLGCESIETRLVH